MVIFFLINLRDAVWRRLHYKARMTRAPFVFGFLVAAAGQASAQLSLKDFVLGVDLAETATRYGMVCKADRSDAALQYCFNAHPTRPEALRSIAGVAATRVIIAGDDAGKVGSVMYSFGQADFSTVREAIASKYPGLTCSDSMVQNQMGAAFEQTKCRYAGDGGVLHLERRSGKVTEGMIEILSDSYLASMLRSADRVNKKAKKDI